MRIIFILSALVLSCAAYDQSLFRRRRDLAVLAAIELSIDEAELNQQQKKIKRHRLEVIPLGWRKKRKQEYSKCNYFSTKPRDIRFSDQRKIRRMFSNL